MSNRLTIFNGFWRTPLGRCFVHNVLDSVRLGTLDRSRAATVLDRLAGIVGTSGADPLDQVGPIIDANSAFLTSRIKPSTLPPFVATSFNAFYAVSQLRAHPNASLRSLGTAISDFYTIGARGHRSDLDAKAQRVQQLIRRMSDPSPDGLIPLDLTGPMLGPKPFGWYTSYDQGDEEGGCWLPRPAWHLRGDATRDILGLIHYGSTSASPYRWEPMLLATYVVPSSAFDATVTFARPNGFDGLGGTRFKARFGRANGPTAEWGRTVNLAKLCGPRPHRGGKEIVIENCIPADTIRFTIAGAVWVPRRDVLGVDDVVFEASVTGKRQKAGRERAFLSL